MSRKLLPGLLMLWMAGWAMPSSSPAAVVAPPSSRAPLSVYPIAQPEGAPGHWDIFRVTCRDLLNASNDDRAAAAMFYYGYLSAKTGTHVINVNAIDGNIEKVMEVCKDSPNITVVHAFDRALRPHR